MEGREVTHKIETHAYILARALLYSGGAVGLFSRVRCDEASARDSRLGGALSQQSSLLAMLSLEKQKTYRYSRTPIIDTPTIPKQSRSASKSSSHLPQTANSTAATAPLATSPGILSAPTPPAL